MKELQQTPIPPDVFQSALDALVERGIIEKNERNRGQRWFAKRTGINERTIRRWIAGETPITGGNAALVRLILEPYF